MHSDKQTQSAAETEIRIGYCFIDDIEFDIFFVLKSKNICKKDGILTLLAAHSENTLC